MNTNVAIWFTEASEIIAKTTDVYIFKDLKLKFEYFEYFSSKINYVIILTNLP